MRDIASMYKPIQLIAPIAMTATVTGVGQLITPNEDTDAVAVVQLGAVAGTPDSFTAVVTIEASATLNGTYTVLSTFATATAGAQIGTKQVVLPIVSKPYVRAKVTIAFVNGTTPSFVCGVSLLVKQNTNTSSNQTALA